MNKLLLPQDIVGGSFWLISVGMIGAAIFFFLERRRLSETMGLSLLVAGAATVLHNLAVDGIVNVAKKGVSKIGHFFKKLF